MQLKERNRQVEELKAELEAKDDQIDQLQKEKASRDDQIEELKKELEDYKMRESRLKKELETQAKSSSLKREYRPPPPVPTEEEEKNKWEVDRKEIKLIEKLGEGRFKEAWKAMWKKKMVAVKKMRPGKTMPAEEFLKETEIMKHLNHKRLVEFYAVSTHEEPIYIVIELMTNGNLFDYLKSNKESLEEKDLIEMCHEIAEGMAYMETKNYIHRDLAARNILVSGNVTCKVANFSLACITGKDHNENPKTLKLPIKWIAPESAKNRQFSFKSDVWSYGIVLYEIITRGRFPYQGMTNAEVLEQVPQGYRMPKPSGCPDKLYEIMQTCWKEKPDQRYRFETLQYMMEDFYKPRIYDYVKMK